MIEIGAWTTPGPNRVRNEDAVALPGVLITGAPPAPVRMQLLNHPGALMIAVVDGMGGQIGGQEAAHLIGSGVADAGATNCEDLLHVLNGKLYDEMLLRPALEAMGATVVAVEIAQTYVDFCNVGDARGYTHTNGYSTVVTTEDRRVPESNEVTQSLGGLTARTDVFVHRTRIDASVPLRMLLCSDGLSDAVQFSFIQEALDQPDVVQCCTDLMQLADLCRRTGQRQRCSH